jgi:hypothetical protein
MMCCKGGGGPWLWVEGELTLAVGVGVGGRAGPRHRLGVFYMSATGAFAVAVLAVESPAAYASNSVASCVVCGSCVVGCRCT